MKITWQCVCRDTQPGDTVGLVGSHPVIGNWQHTSAIRLSTDVEWFPVWRTPTWTESPVYLLEYKYIILSENGEVRWEPTQGNRIVQLQPDSACLVENVWGSNEANSITFTPLRRSDAGFGGYARGNQENSRQNFPSEGSRLSQRKLATETEVSTASSTERDRRHPVMVDSQDDSSSKGKPFFSNYEESDSARSGGNGNKERDRTSQIHGGAFVIANNVPITQYYKMSRIVGRGTWGEVFIVEETATGAIRAAKKIPKCYVEDVERFSNEIDIMKWMDHPNIVRLHETFEDAHDFYLVEEYCQGGELLDRLMEEGSFTELSASKIMKQILLAVSYCHSQGVAHRDLKPENFLFLNETPDSPLKLIDFGLARRFAHSRAMQTKAGTPYYVAPQVLLGNYGPECDVWSAGVIMYILLCGYPPFNAPSDRSIMEKVDLL
eukprot:GHVN01066753.1.p1 GENE.GHVN01066753.1~~GHVN01066753.1.p1  ORF type:complete len:436 (+),score=36.50 GHVN01066753.1:1403-2710(+)